MTHIEYPRDLRHHRPPLAIKPEPPAPGERVQIGFYTVEARQCPDPQCKCGQVIRYNIYNVCRSGGIDGKGLLAQGRNWDRLCHIRGWYDDPSTVERKPLPSSGSSPQPSTKRAAPSSGERGSSASSAGSRRSSSAPDSNRSSKPKPGPSTPPSSSPAVSGQLGLFGSDPHE